MGPYGALIRPLLGAITKEFVMSMKTSASVVIALSAMLFLGCGNDSGAGSGDVKKGCTERDGGWFGRLDNGSIAISQTKEACEERLRE
jgi:hypothetical protein